MAFRHHLNNELSIEQIIAGNTSKLNDFLDVFVDLFPQYSYRTDRLREIAENSPDFNPLFIEHQWLVELRGEAVAMTTFKYLPKRNLGIGVHLAIRPAYRHYAINHFSRMSEIIIEETREQIVKDALALGHPIPPGYIIEVVEPKLISRYEEYGFIPFDLPYHEPTISQKNKAFVQYDQETDLLEFHPAVIGIIPIRNQTIDPYDPNLLENAINAFLIDYYELGETHWVLEKARKRIAKIKKTR